MRRFDKVHAQAARSLPKPQLEPARRWRELDSSMSSDALLMNIFCTPGVAESTAIRNALGVDAEAVPIFGWKARVPLASGRFDRTEVDMRFGSLLVEAKLTEVGFQSRAAGIVEAYRDFDSVFDRDRLPRVEIATSRWMRASEFPENESQEFESVVADPALFSRVDPSFRAPGEAGYASYQLIRSVLAAHAAGCSFCVIHDERRPDLREEWFKILVCSPQRRDARPSQGAHLAGTGRASSRRVAGVPRREIRHRRTRKNAFADRRSDKSVFVAPDSSPAVVRASSPAPAYAAMSGCPTLSRGLFARWVGAKGPRRLRPYSPRIFRLRAASALPPAKSSNARSVTRMIWSRTNFAPSAAPSSGCLMQHSHSTTAHPG